MDPASTYRRLQRFFLHVRLEEDWAAPLLAGVAGGAEKRTLIIDRTNWKVGETNINLFVLAVRTRHSQVPLMGTVLATDRHRRPGRRLVGPGRKNRPGPNAKDPRLPRQILFPNRLHTAAKLLRRNDPKIVIEWVRLKIAGILTRVVESEFQVNEKR